MYLWIFEVFHPRSMCGWSDYYIVAGISETDARTRFKASVGNTETEPDVIGPYPITQVLEIGASDEGITIPEIEKGA